MKRKEENNMSQLMKKIIVATLCAVLCISILSACNQESADSNTTTTTASVGESADEESEEIETTTEEDRSGKDDLSDYNFEEYEFKIFARQPGDWFHAYYDFEELPSEEIDAAIYMRNRNLEDRFNISINFVNGTDSTKAKNALNAGLNEYDMMQVRCAEAFDYAVQGLIRSANDLKYVDTSKAYWDEPLNKQLEVAHKRYFLVGAFNLSSYDYTHVLLFNKKLISDYSLENPYELVKSGQWTYDAFDRMAKGITNDINGDSIFDINDSYGFLSPVRQVLPNFWISAGQTTVAMDSEGKPYSRISNEGFINAFNRTFEITRDNNAWYNSEINEAGVHPTFISMFQGDRALFMANTFRYLGELRNMESDFGILPYPKLNGTQENYYTRLEGCELFVIGQAASDEDVERTSVILEAMASESYKSVIPLYYEKALKTKIARDDESAEIIDMLFENRVFDFGDTNWSIDIRDGVFQGMFKNDNRNIVSKAESMDNVIAKLSDKMFNAFLELN